MAMVGSSGGGGRTRAKKISPIPDMPLIPLLRRRASIALLMSMALSMTISMLEKMRAWSRIGKIPRSRIGIMKHCTKQSRS